MSNIRKKWADYGISAVRYDAEHNHIDQLRVHEDKGGPTIGKGETRTRKQIVDAIKSGTTFVTILKNSEGKWIEGQPVEIVTVRGVEYLKTEQNDTEGDNLENLPEF